MLQKSEFKDENKCFTFIAYPLGLVDGGCEVLQGVEEREEPSIGRQREESRHQPGHAKRSPNKDSQGKESKQLCDGHLDLLHGNWRGGCISGNGGVVGGGHGGGGGRTRFGFPLAPVDKKGHGTKAAEAKGL